MTLYHHSRQSFCRTPFGAASCDTRVTLRLFVGDGGWPDSVSLICCIDGGEETQLPMHYHSAVAGMSVYEAVLDMPSEPCLIRYFFRAAQGNHILYYGNNPDLTGGAGSTYESDPKPYQITVYMQDYRTPDWFKQGVMYQIFPDRFAKSEAYDSLAVRDDILPRTWGDMPYYKPEQFGGEYLANDFFGGSLAGIIDKLPYLAELGITVLYLNPIFEAFSNHKYDTGDYEKIDPMFGDEAMFTELCRKAGELGMRIILDGVFNHTGADSKYFNIKGRYPTTGAYQSKDSPYYHWYQFEDYPDRYACWWGIRTLPHVDETQPSYMDYILRGRDAVIKKWIRAGASGWRLDVVDELPETFLRVLRAEVKRERPDAVIIGEVWEDASNKESYGALRHYLGGQELDGAMNYPLRGALIYFMIGNIGGREFYERVMSLYENYPRQAFLAMMNFLGSHDTPRILTALSGAPNSAVMTRDAQAAYKLTEKQRATAIQRLKRITALQMCLPGVPCIYYGDEVGMEGYSDPFCRQCFPWQGGDMELQRWFREAIARRKASRALSAGEFDMVYGEGRCCGFVRYCEDEFKLVMANADEAHDWFAWVELGRFGIAEIYDTDTDKRDTAADGRFGICMPPGTVRIFEGNLK